MAIIKILTRHTPSYRTLLGYIFDKSREDERYTQNLRASDIYTLNNEFTVNESFRQRHRSDQVYLYHEILAFHGFDATAMTIEAMTDIAREYMRLRGRDTVIAAAVHRDREHVHLHACVSALRFRTGTSARLSKAELAELKHSLQEYHRQKFPEIVASFPEHGKALRLAKAKEQRDRAKAEIADIVRECRAKAATRQEFLTLLREHDLHHYERNGVPTGILHDDVKFRFGRLLDEPLDTLPEDRTEEEQALADIRAIRERRAVRDREGPDLERD